MSALVLSLEWLFLLYFVPGYFLPESGIYSDVVDNLMSYKRTSVLATFLDDKQGRKIRSFARIYLRSKEVTPLIADPPGPGAKPPS